MIFNQYELNLFWKTTCYFSCFLIWIFHDKKKIKSKEHPSNSWLCLDTMCFSLKYVHILIWNFVTRTRELSKNRTILENLVSTALKQLHVSKASRCRCSVHCAASLVFIYLLWSGVNNGIENGIWHYLYS